MACVSPPKKSFPASHSANRLQPLLHHLSAWGGTSSLHICHWCSIAAAWLHAHPAPATSPTPSLSIVHALVDDGALLADLPAQCCLTSTAKCLLLIVHCLLPSQLPHHNTGSYHSHLQEQLLPQQLWDLGLESRVVQHTRVVVQEGCCLLLCHALLFSQKAQDRLQLEVIIHLPKGCAHKHGQQCMLGSSDADRAGLWTCGTSGYCGNKVVLCSIQPLYRAGSVKNSHIRCGVFATSCLVCWQNSSQ